MITNVEAAENTPENVQDGDLLKGGGTKRDGQINDADSDAAERDTREGQGVTCPCQEVERGEERRRDLLVKSCDRCL